MATPGQKVERSRPKQSLRAQGSEAPRPVITGAERLALPAEDGSAHAFRRSLVGICERFDVDPVASGDLVLAASEAFSNALRHGTATEDDAIEAWVRMTPTFCQITLEYPGEPFSVRSPRLPSATATHGRGRYLMSMLVDDVEYEFAAGVTRVSLRKHWG
jgi:serine/threonine-protein kinase RsbW